MPSTDQGFNSWEDGFLQGDGYLNGLAIPKFRAYKRDPQEGTLFGLKTHANTMIAQRLYHGVEAPRLRQGFNFSGSWKLWSKEVAEAIREAVAIGEPFLFCPLDRATDVFDAVSGSSYKLTRPVARDTVGWITALTHPDLIKLDGVEDSGAATISGQDVTANDTGVITIHYTPIYEVIGKTVSHDIPANNEFNVSFLFEEFVTF